MATKPSKVGRSLLQLLIDACWEQWLVDPVACSDGVPSCKSCCPGGKAYISHFASWGRRRELFARSPQHGQWNRQVAPSACPNALVPKQANKGQTPSTLAVGLLVAVAVAALDCGCVDGATATSGVPSIQEGQQGTAPSDARQVGWPRVRVTQA